MDVLVCDDHPIVAAAIGMTIETAFDATVTVAASYRQALAIAHDRSNFALCLLDIHIPGEDARSGVRALRAALPDTRFVLFSGSDDHDDLMLTLELDLHGFLPKSSTPEVIDAALRLVLAGGAYLPRGIGDLALRHASPDRVDGAVTAAVAGPLYGTLTDRQHAVLQHVARGRSNKDIARDLAISPATVKAHVAQIIAVLGAVNRTEAAARARTLGLIDL